MDKTRKLKFDATENKYRAAMQADWEWAYQTWVANLPQAPGTPFSELLFDLFWMGVMEGVRCFAAVLEDGSDPWDSELLSHCAGSHAKAQGVEIGSIIFENGVLKGPCKGKTIFLDEFDCRFLPALSEGDLEDEDE